MLIVILEDAVQSVNADQVRSIYKSYCILLLIFTTYTGILGCSSKNLFVCFVNIYLSKLSLITQFRFSIKFFLTNHYSEAVYDKYNPKGPN